MRSRSFPLLAAALALLSSASSSSAATGYLQTNLASDIAGASHTDPNLVNPWGMASSSASPIWVADNGTGVSTLYNGSGTPQGLVVTLPGVGGGAGDPTGMAFNPTTDFKTGTPDLFLFAAEDGLISGWRGALGTTAEVNVDNSSSGAVYKGLTIANNGTNHLLATNFNSGAIDVFDGNFGSTTLGGNFTDPGLPSGFAPFGIRNIGGVVYVTYAKQDGAKHDDVPGAGNGYVDTYDTNGVFTARLVTQGVLNSPWGIAIAPPTFGDFAGALLIGNFGDGKINAFNATTGAFLGTLSDAGGNAIVIPGLWGLLFGNGGSGGATGELFFTAGIPGSGAIEDHGLFGKLAPAPPPVVTVPTLGAPMAAVLALVLALVAVTRLTVIRRKRRA